MLGHERAGSALWARFAFVSDVASVYVITCLPSTSYRFKQANLIRL
jgi:hypothetical protein